MSKKAIVIGSGFSGLSAAAFMAKAGWDVTVLEKNASPGGRARQLNAEGFLFDMGPSWYWMPDVFERFFQQFGKKVCDYYSLKRLSPSYRVYWKEEVLDIPSEFREIKNLFESLEKGAAENLEKFLEEAAYKYQIGMKKLVLKPGLSITEFFDWDIVKGVFRMDIFTSMKKHVSKYFKHPMIRHLMEFPVLFLGALPEKTPALYSLMNYADIVGGTWYPKGGMHRIVEAMHNLAIEQGVKFYFNEEVKKIMVENNHAKSVKTESSGYDADVVIGGADYHFIETELLSPEYRNYSNSYWEKREMAPSCLIYYIGLNKKLNNLSHHSLFFDASFDNHARDIYKNKQWPEDPLFYLCAPSVTDETVAPIGNENLFFLVPMAAGLSFITEEQCEKCFESIVKRTEKKLGQSISDSIVYKKSFTQNDFIKEYHSFRGNAYGLSNTLLQTAIFKPSCRNKKVKNLFYTGQLTVPGPGIPPCIISGEVVANEVLKIFS